MFQFALYLRQIRIPRYRPLVTASPPGTLKIQTLAADSKQIRKRAVQEIHSHIHILRHDRLPREPSAKLVPSYRRRVRFVKHIFDDLECHAGTFLIQRVDTMPGRRTPRLMGVFMATRGQKGAQAPLPTWRFFLPSADFSLRTASERELARNGRQYSPHWLCQSRLDLVPVFAL